MNTMLVISPHPDDETLGAGGAILRQKHLGHKVFWLNVTNMKEEFGYSRQDIIKRKKELELVCREYKLDGFFDMGLKPAGLDCYKKSQLTAEISGVIRRVKPETIILPYGEDIHSDHKIVFDAASSASKNFRNPSVRRTLVMEVLSETNFAFSDTGFVPNFYFNIDQFIDKKVKIMKIYKGEMKKHPFPRSVRSIKALALLRGAQAGCKYAEAFKVVKWVE